jgi:hypothetical protein
MIAFKPKVSTYDRTIKSAEALDAEYGELGDKTLSSVAEPLRIDP